MYIYIYISYHICPRHAFTFAHTVWRKTNVLVLLHTYVKISLDVGLPASLKTEWLSLLAMHVQTLSPSTFVPQRLTWHSMFSKDTRQFLLVIAVYRNYRHCAHQKSTWSRSRSKCHPVFFPTKPMHCKNCPWSCKDSWWNNTSTAVFCQEFASYSSWLRAKWLRHVAVNLYWHGDHSQLFANIQKPCSWKPTHPGLNTNQQHKSCVRKGTNRIEEIQCGNRRINIW